MVLDDEESGSVTVTSGVPQGSVLGPKIIVDIYIQCRNFRQRAENQYSIHSVVIYLTLFSFSQPLMATAGGMVCELSLLLAIFSTNILP